MITVTITNPRYIAAATAAYTATIPVQPDPPAEQLPIPYADVTDYAQKAVDRLCESWAESTGVDRIPVGAFVRRFPGVVMDAVVASADPNVIAILAQLDAVTHVRLGASTTLNGVGYLVSAGFLTQEQADMVLAY